MHPYLFRKPSSGVPGPSHYSLSDVHLRKLAPELARRTDLDSENLCTLGFCYEHGLGVKEDKREAFSLYTKAAKLGLLNAIRNVATCYFYGVGTPQDPNLAFSWSKRGAEQGDPDSQCIHGNCYDVGYGDTKSKVEAKLEWYHKAAEKDWPRGIYNIAVCYDVGDIVPQDTQKALEYYTRAASLGYPWALFNLGVSYERGTGVIKDYTKAFQLYSLASAYEHPGALCNMGYLYKMGFGVGKDVMKAIDLYKKAAEFDNAVAQCNLGLNYERGCGVPKDDKIAFSWYKKSAENNDAGAQERLAHFYIKGIANEVPVDYSKAIYWLKKSSEKNNVAATFRLAKCYEIGTGVNKNLLLAAQMYFDLAQKNIEKATEKFTSTKMLWSLLLGSRWPMSHFDLHFDCQKVSEEILLSSLPTYPAEIVHVIIQYLVEVWPDDHPLNLKKTQS